MGEDPRREGLLLTPMRVAKSLSFLTDGYVQDAAALLHGAMFQSDTDEMVVVKDIELYSMCEHHMLPFFGRAHVAYLPAKRIVGLSKLARVVDVFAKRLQVQERLTTQIADAIHDALKPRGRRRRHRGAAPLHDDARRDEAEQQHGDVVHAGRLPVRPQDADRVPAVRPTLIVARGGQVVARTACGSRCRSA